MKEPVTVFQVERITFRLAQEKFEYDEPIPEFKTRFPNILESCLAAPLQTFDGKDLYPSFFEKTAILFYLMTKNHPFQNGNKRIAITTLFYALYTNGLWIEISNQELYNFAVWIAGSPRDAKDETVKYITKFIKTYSIPWEKEQKNT
ncbi:MAG: type II toxin-antitoxin system death-on-curing family toxin [Candidatus Omnitrophota bacterium]